jgi:hypothetical protein
MPGRALAGRLWPAHLPAPRPPAGRLASSVRDGRRQVFARAPKDCPAPDVRVPNANTATVSRAPRTYLRTSRPGLGARLNCLEEAPPPRSPRASNSASCRNAAAGTLAQRVLRLPLPPGLLEWAPASPLCRSESACSNPPSGDAGGALAPSVRDGRRQVFARPEGLPGARRTNGPTEHLSCALATRHLDATSPARVPATSSSASSPSWSPTSSEPSCRRTRSVASSTLHRDRRAFDRATLTSLYATCGSSCLARTHVPRARAPPHP